MIVGQPAARPKPGLPELPQVAAVAAVEVELEPVRIVEQHHPPDRGLHHLVRHAQRVEVRGPCVHRGPVVDR